MLIFILFSIKSVLGNKFAEMFIEFVIVLMMVDCDDNKDGDNGGDDDDDEEEEEESDPEIDEDDPLLYNCPFCLGLFEDKVDMNNHVDGCMPV